MGFDLKKFASAKFQDRIVEVSVPQLKAFFAEGEKPVFKIRGLSGEEVFQVREAMKRAEVQEELVRGFLSDNAQEKARAILEELGLQGNSVPEDFVRHIEVILRGTVEPPLMGHRSEIVKLARESSTTFQTLGDQILIATGKGRVLGESNASGETRASK